jgi:two-component sensor histidine kinase
MESPMSLELVLPSVTPLDVADEANHRIGNNLSVIAALVRMHWSSISENPRTMSGDEVRLFLEEVCGRLDAVARLHRLLGEGQQRGSIKTAEYLREIAEAAISSLSFAGTTELQFTCDPRCIVSPERALSLGFILGELVTNAVKYAHPAGVAGRVSVDCRRGPDDIIVIEISDDGVGLPEDFDPAKDGHVGFRLVRSLATQLGATIAFHNDSLGLTVRLAIPPEESKHSK